MRESGTVLLGLFVLGVVGQKVVSDVVDRVLGFVRLLGQGRKGLQHQGDYCLVEVGTNRQSL